LTLPWLSVEELEAIWNKVQQMPCYAALGNKTRHWIELYHALSQRQFNRVSELANALLGTGAIAKKKHYLLTVIYITKIENQN
jgi:hypothetical protein